jgi:flavin reductase (DIM6/NTAB) family NADH-FMN oxidoreductase RutF
MAVSPEAFRDALSHWASGVTVVAVREEDGTLHATTVSSFASVSAEPPRILISLGPGAQVLPFLDPGHRFVVNILSHSQTRLATIFADPFPVGPSPFPSEGDPVVAGSLAVLVCGVEGVIPVDGVRLVLGRVLETQLGVPEEPLVNYRREYRSVTE